MRFSHSSRPNNQRGGFYHEKDIKKSNQLAAHTHADVQRSYDVPEYSFGDGKSHRCCSDGLLAGWYEKFEVFGYFVFCQHWCHCYDEISRYSGLNCARLCRI